MKRIIFLIFASLISAGALTGVSFAEPYWEQFFNQSGAETWQYAADPNAQIGEFDGIQVIWDAGSKFTTSPLALSEFTSGTWDVDQTNELSAFARRSGGTTSYSDFFINFKNTTNPFVTNFYYGVFRGNELIQSQLFNITKTSWTQNSVDKNTFLAKAAGVVPEPVSCALFLLGGAVLGIKKLREKK